MIAGRFFEKAVRAALLLPVLLGFVMLAVTAGPISAIANEDLSSIVRGGRLYDNWYVEAHDRAPKTSHPAYPSSGKFANDPETNWRCKECHGWDYMGKDGAYAEGPHYTGIKGIRGMAGADPAKIIAVLKDDTHGYGTLIEEDDLLDLANFVSKGQIDTDQFINRKTKLVMKDSKKREAYFTSICGHCHGNDGQRFRSIPPLGKLATTDPWHTLHNILNGHPGENMPALRVFGVETLAQLLAYVQTLPVEPLASSIARGGRLYDNWYVETDRRAPEVRHAAYPSDGPKANEPNVNWRCQECHGWDYKGKDGVYSEGPHFTGIKGIQGMAGADPAKIIALLKDETHGYRGRLEYRDFQDLANFVSKGQIDMDKFIDRATLVSNGDEGASESYFTTICAACHGTDGRKIRTMLPLGRIARTNPWNALHHIMNGHPDEEMPALRVLLGIPNMVDILTYAQSLPGR